MSTQGPSGRELGCCYRSKSEYGRRVSTPVENCALLPGWMLSFQPSSTPSVRRKRSVMSRPRSAARSHSRSAADRSFDPRESRAWIGRCMTKKRVNRPLRTFGEASRCDVPQPRGNALLGTRSYASESSLVTDATPRRARQVKQSRECTRNRTKPRRARKGELRSRACALRVRIFSSGAGPQGQASGYARPTCRTPRR